MIVKFWGVRGSFPSPGNHTLRYGGNTSCVSVEVDGKVLVLDAGSGIRSLGAALRGDGREVFVLLSHVHNDHILGLPFFAPLFEPGRKVHLLDYHHDGRHFSLLDMIDGVHFPLRTEDLPSAYRRVQGNPLGYLADHGLVVTRQAMNHPGGAYGYRIAHDGRAFIYMPDNEIDAPPQTHAASFDTLAAFCRDADLLCHDAQYLRHDMPYKRGWGHSLVHRACDLAIAAAVRHLVLFHHDPDRSDDAVDELQAGAQRQLDAHNISCTAAREGLAFDLT